MMRSVSIVAENAGRALAQIHEQLGPEAVVLNVRKLPASGIARLWKPGGTIEVTAGVPEAAASHRTLSTAGGEAGSFDQPTEIGRSSQAAPRRWRSVAWLESLGLLPALADLLEAKVSSVHGEIPPVRAAAEWALVRDVLAGFWRPAPPAVAGAGGPHVFIGPAGAGKTTVLAKWLTGAVLGENQLAHVWRLDGETANTAEFLSLQCEMIGVPVERFWNDAAGPADVSLVDLPGVEPGDAAALAALRRRLAALPRPRVHLVLNAATETSILFEQFHAFAPLQPEDVIFTHLDEEVRRVKLWNFVLGTNLPVSFLGAGQKIPGALHRAEPDRLFPPQNPR
jgi:flagellar biosynthesis protein FlhF